MSTVQSRTYVKIMFGCVFLLLLMMFSFLLLLALGVLHVTIPVYRDKYVFEKLDIPLSISHLVFSEEDGGKSILRGGDISRVLSSGVPIQRMPE
ncbi:hypothetical protein CDAR_526421 [Caerostris darwini]|uniref:Uncharacterized protein n=1 Tax=Caerostris darwini TaxID=1538125 RepID=A0AAV4MGE4_9ARAC|nr:hypothetical protein CDAR_526421 [Caerostris darwini]